MDIGFLIIFAVLFICALSLFIWLTIYCVPIIIAYIRKHNNILAISILTVFLGWTFFGWFAAVLWSLNSDVEREEE